MAVSQALLPASRLPCCSSSRQLVFRIATRCSDRIRCKSSPEDPSKQGRLNTSSRTSQQQERRASTKSMQARLDDAGRHFDKMLGHLTPKQEGDVMDVVMILGSLAVLVYLSMQLYRMYLLAIYHMHHYQTMMDLMS